MLLTTNIRHLNNINQTENNLGKVLTQIYHIKIIFFKKIPTSGNIFFRKIDMDNSQKTPFHCHQGSQKGNFLKNCLAF